MLILKSTWKCKLLALTKVILRKNKVERSILFELKTHYKSTEWRQCSIGIRIGYRSVEQNRESKHRCAHRINLWHRFQGNSMRKGQSFEQMVPEELYSQTKE